MSNITSLFKATVKTVKSRNRMQYPDAVDRSILNTKKGNSEFASTANQVVKNISELKDFLILHRKDYINAGRQLGGGTSGMTERERDQIDADAETFMKTCREAIQALKRQAATDKVRPQVKEHRDAMFFLIESYLKVVCKIYSEQKAVRVKLAVDRKRIGRLETKSRKPTNELELLVKDTEKGLREGQEKSDEMLSKKDDENDNKQKSNLMLIENFDSYQGEDGLELSAEEKQMFEAENEQLYQEMNSLVDEVKNIEGKVVEISRLQEIFADKVLEQEKDIDNIADTVVGTTENIKEANEEIREAMKNNAGLRVWILFFLIVCTFSLLFLDWYNA